MVVFHPHHTPMPAEQTHEYVMSWYEGRKWTTGPVRFKDSDIADMQAELLCCNGCVFVVCLAEDASLVLHYVSRKPETYFMDFASACGVVRAWKARRAARERAHGAPVVEAVVVEKV